MFPSLQLRIPQLSTVTARKDAARESPAAKRLPEDKQLIKGHQSLKEKWHKVYYAPHRSGRFIYQDLTFLALHGS